MWAFLVQRRKIKMSDCERIIASLSVSINIFVLGRVLVRAVCTYYDNKAFHDKTHNQINDYISDNDTEIQNIKKALNRLDNRYYDLVAQQDPGKIL